jgi:hypothetical protein
MFHKLSFLLRALRRRRRSWCIGRTTMTHEKLITHSDNCTGVTLCTKNLTPSGLVSQFRLLGKKPANNRRNNGTNLKYEPSSQLKNYLRVESREE